LVLEERPRGMTLLSPFRDVAIAGIGKTEMARRLPTTTLSACLSAMRIALDDAGLGFDDVDGISARWPGPGGTVFIPGSADWASLLGIPVTPIRRAFRPRSMRRVRSPPGSAMSP